MLFCCCCNPAAFDDRIEVSVQALEDCGFQTFLLRRLNPPPQVAPLECFVLLKTRPNGSQWVYCFELPSCWLSSGFGLRDLPSHLWKRERRERQFCNWSLIITAPTLQHSFTRISKKLGSTWAWLVVNLKDVESWNKLPSRRTMIPPLLVAPPMYLRDAGLSLALLIPQPKQGNYRVNCKITASYG